MTTYPELLAQIEELQRQAEQLRQEEFAKVVSTIRQQIEDYGITAQDLGLASVPATRAREASSRAKAPRSRKTAAPAFKVAPKFRDEAGNSWSGRGKQPRWLVDALSRGRSLEEFSIPTHN